MIPIGGACPKINGPKIITKINAKNAGDKSGV